MTEPKAKHTPGPWAWEKVAGQKTARVYKWNPNNLPPMVALKYREHLIARVELSGPGFGQHDARLISAAPALLKAAKAVLNEYRPDFKKHNVPTWDQLGALFAAIALAEGRAK